MVEPNIIISQYKSRPVHTNFDGVDSAIFVFLQGFASDMRLLHMSLR